MFRRISLAFLVLVFAVSGFLLYTNLPLLRVASAFKAKMLCSGVFVAERPHDHLAEHDFHQWPLYLLTSSVDREAQTVTASWYGLAAATAKHRPGYGAVLLNGTQPVDLVHETQRSNSSQLWPGAEKPLDREVDTEAIERAIDLAFEENLEDAQKNTRAVLVVYQGRLVGERYAPGFSADTRQIGWSMTKSVVNALVGMLVGEGKINVYDRAPVAQWQVEGDPRQAITWDNLLRMSSGLRFEESYINPHSDVLQMLYASSDFGEHAAGLPLIHEPGSHYSYSSGTSNILSRLLADVIGGSHEDYLKFPHERLFAKIGMDSAVFEVDPAGYYVGSSYLYATPRDWARFGLLYLNNGVWQGERILSEEWLDYSRTSTPASPKGQHGAHLWTNQSGRYPQLARNMFWAAGYQGQCLAMFPDHDLLLVRFGLSDPTESFDLQEFALPFLEAL